MNISAYQKEIQLLNKKIRHHLYDLLYTEFHKYQITDLQYEALAFIYEHEGCSIGVMAKAFQQDPGNASNLCKKLEKMDYLLRQKNPEDERKASLFLTLKGTQCVEEIKQKLKQHYDKQWNKINEDDQALIMSGLHKLNGILELITGKEDSK